MPAFSYVLSPQNNVKAVVSALDQVSDVNVISSPQVFVLDNQAASIMVGDSVPMTTQSAQSIVTDNAPIINSIEYRDTGVILEVRPRVNAGGLVTMEIYQEVSLPSTFGPTDGFAAAVAARSTNVWWNRPLPCRAARRWRSVD